MSANKTVLINGDIITLARNKEKANSLVMKGEKISEIDPPLPHNLKSEETRQVIDLRGKSVIPGMADGHIHFTYVGLGLIFPDLRNAASVADLLNGVSKALKDHPKGEMFLAWNFDENLFREKRLPTLEELDCVAPSTPVWINRVGMNASVFNTKAWEQVNLPLTYSRIPTGPDGKPLGSISGNANWVGLARVLNSLSDEVRLKAFQAAAAHCATLGTTTAHAVEGCFAMGMPDRPDFACLDAPCLIKNRDKIDMDVVIWYQHILNFSRDISLMKEYGLSKIGGDLFLDGVLGAALAPGVLRAALSEPYLDDPSTKGDLTYSDDAIEELVHLSWKEGLQFSAHAVGDRAISQIITAYKKALEKKPGDARFRIEHFILPPRERLKESVDLGIVFSMQPAFDYYSGGPDGRYAKRLGLERARWTNPFQDILRAGGVIVGGSDAPTNTIDPMLGIHSMVNHRFAEQRTSAMEALRAFTSNAAFSVFEENQKGTIEVGKQADLAILSENPLTVNPSKIKDIQIEMTFYKGKMTFKSEHF
jgi:predicted amidohydrolase YtcJ